MLGHALGDDARRDVGTGARGQRYDVANYSNVFIPTNLEVADDTKKQFGAFYAALFDEAIAKAGGRAIVTEYAWTSAGCDPCPTPPLDQSAEATVTNVNSLIQRVAGTSLAEIENLISELESLRDLLHAEGQRVQREISGYAQLSQAAMKSTRMISDNVSQWKRTADGLRNS